jgi:hypothetical protein
MPISPKEADNKLHKNNNWQMRNPKADKYLMCCSFTNVTRSLAQKEYSCLKNSLKILPLFFLLLPCLKVSYIC